MDFQSLHEWNPDYTEAKNLQIKLREYLDLSPRNINVKTIAGCDVSQAKWSNIFTSAVVIMSFPDFEIIETEVSKVKVDFPYIPGLLSFREMPPLIESWRKIKIIPDLVFCDGSGYIHPRRFGLACHLGLWLNLPTIGCAKNLLCGQTEFPGNDKGSRTNVYLDDEVVGATVRTRTGVKPMYISPGNLISLEQSIQYVLEACPKYRIPEPVRAAHKAANLARTEMV